MNRRNQGTQSGRGQQTQQGQHRLNSRTSSQGYQSQDMDNEYEGMQAGSRSGVRGNYSGLNTSYGDDNYDLAGAQSYRDTDYDLDGSTYGNSSRSQRGLNDRRFSSYGEYETNDRNREPSRYSSLDDDRSWDRSERSFDRHDRPTERYNSSSERFGYPSSMNTWRGNDRSAGGESSSRGARMGQSSMSPWSSQDNDSHIGMGSQFGSQTEMGMGIRSQRGFFGKGPKGYKRSDDRIKEDVCETLARNPRVDASDIEVKVEDACVTLYGTVDNKEIKRAAEMAIENLSGVDDVRNEIKVKKMGERSDSSIHASSGTSAHERTGSTASTTQTESKSTKNSSL